MTSPHPHVLNQRGAQHRRATRAHREAGVASIDRRPNGKWRARFRLHPGGPQRARHFERKIDAERFLVSVQSQLLDGSYLDPAAGRITFGEYAAAWQEAQVHRPSTVAQVDAHLRNHVLPIFGDHPLASIRPTEVRAWVNGRTAVLAPATVEVVFRIFAAILGDTVSDRLVATNPAKGMKLPTKVAKPVVPPTVAHVEAIGAELPERYQALVTLAAGAGLRQGECFGLSVDRVDFLRRSITVNRQLVLVGGSPPVFGPPKTAASIRSIPLPDVVGNALARHLERWSTGDDGLIFTNDRGEALRRNRFNEVWRAARGRAGLGDLRFHDLRDFYASLLIAHGESVKIVQARLGHASASETLGAYAPLWPDNEERTRAAVDDVLGHPARMPAGDDGKAPVP
jgi:integrase